MQDQSGECSEQTVRILAVVVAQLQLALRESHRPASQLCDSLSAALQAAGRLRHCAGAASADSNWQELHRSLSECLTGMQFHDRMIQHLTHLGSFLADLSCCWGDRLDYTGAIGRLRAHLITDAQRELLDMLSSDHPLPPQGKPLAKPDDSVQLF